MAGSACGPVAADHGRNINWRVALIAYKNAPGSSPESPPGVVAFVPLLGLIVFLCAFISALSNPQEHKLALVTLCVASWLSMFIGYWLKTRKERRGWKIADGRCVDRQLKRVYLADTFGGGGWGWVWRVVCEYEHAGIKYRVTPDLSWVPLGSEKRALLFLERRISSDGQCKLRFNPKNPLQTGLFCQGILDKLIY